MSKQNSIVLLFYTSSASNASDKYHVCDDDDDDDEWEGVCWPFQEMLASPGIEELWNHL